MLSPTSTMTPAPPRAMGVNLVMFFAFALAALLLLTETLVSVTNVQTDVSDAVQPATSDMVVDTALLSQLAQTNLLTGQMLEAAQHINGSLTEVTGSTQLIRTQLADVRSDSLAIAASVTGLAQSSAAVLDTVAGLRTSVDTTDRRASQVASALAGASQAVAPLRNSLDGVNARLEPLVALIPSITQQAKAITETLADVDGHLRNVDANALVRLTNVLQLGPLVPSLALNGK